MNQSPPMGRMLRRALGEPTKTMDRFLESYPYIFVRNFVYKVDNQTHVRTIRKRSLNTQGVQFRVRQLQWDCIRLRKGLGELYTPEEQNAHLAKPATKKDILNGYLQAGHYFNNFKPRV